MITPSLPAGLVRSLALLCGTALAIAAAWHPIVSIVAHSDLASVTLLVGGSGIVAWAAARISTIGRITTVQAFGAGLTLPVAFLFLLPRRPSRAANDNDQAFSGSWPQFINE